MQGVIANLAGALPRVTILARGLIQLAGEGVPVKRDESLALATLDEHGKPLDRHHQFQRLQPCQIYFHRILPAHIADLGLVLAGDCFQPLALSRLFGLVFIGQLPTGGQSRQASCRLPLEVVMINEDPLEVPLLAACHAGDKGVQPEAKPWRQGAFQDFGRQRLSMERS